MLPLDSLLKCAIYWLSSTFFHSTPLKYEPIEVFLAGIDQSKVDKSTEEWLDRIEDRLKYEKWYCGHYHTEKKIDRLEILFENVSIFCEEQSEI